MYIDSHAHLSSDALFPEADVLVKRAQEAQVSHIVNICTDQASLKKGLELHKKYPFIVNAASTTPHDVEALGETDFSTMEAAAKQGLLCAIGETGLDYHYQHSPKEKQKEFLIRYCHLANSFNLPLIIHCREAFADLFQILDKEHPQNVLLHCFTGTLEEALGAVDRGWLISLSGIVTFKKSIELQETAQQIPLANLLIETDAPYLSPQSKRGKTNEPAFLLETAAYLANLKGLPVEEFGIITSKNARLFFKL